MARKVKEKIAAFLNSTRHYSVIQDRISVASQMEKMTLMVHFLTANEVEISQQWRSPEQSLKCLYADYIPEDGMINVFLKMPQDKEIAIAKTSGQGY